MNSVTPKKTESSHMFKEEVARNSFVLFSCLLFFLWLLYSSAGISFGELPIRKNLIISTKHATPGTEGGNILTLDAPGALSSLTEHSFSPFFFAPILINYCDAELLMTIDGIGPVLAGNILATRVKIGGFASKQDLLLVNGIGEKRLEQLAPCFSFRQLP